MHNYTSQRFFEEHFGKRTRVFWLPDSFGYSAQLPQVLRESGCDFFFTQKLSWNNINKFPLSTFWWTGIDDTKILAHLTPAETYTASVTASEVYKWYKLILNFLICICKLTIFEILVLKTIMILRVRMKVCWFTGKCKHTII